MGNVEQGLPAIVERGVGRELVGNLAVEAQAGAGVGEAAADGQGGRGEDRGGDLIEEVIAQPRANLHRRGVKGQTAGAQLEPVDVGIALALGDGG